MAYQNVGTPRFFINEVSYRQKINQNPVLEDTSEELKKKHLYGINPSNSVSIVNDDVISLSFVFEKDIITIS